MEDTSGFYKHDGDVLFGPNFVLNANYELRRETKEQHTYPTDGWPSNPTGPAVSEFGIGKVLRGGSWGGSWRSVRSAYRELNPADWRYYGFRCARSP